MSTMAKMRVTCIFIAGCVFIASVLVYLASVYGSEAFSFWRPPNTQLFQKYTTIVGVLAILLSTGISFFGIILGKKLERIVSLAALPATFLFLYLAVHSGL